jgi:pimeloyl-ACP methyl ester carboxylesterase
MKKFFKWLGIVVLAIVFLVIGLWSYLLIRSHITYVLPKPTGSYHVGHRMYDWTDANRSNAFVGKPQEKRELMADVWYPTNQTSGTPAPYLPAAWQKAADDQDGGGTLLKHPLSRIKTNGFENATVANRKFPLVIFQPGYGRNAADYTAFAENLASNGYIVVASSPTYIADLVVLGDGQVVKSSPKAALPENVSGLDPSMKQASEKLLAVWTGDDSFLIDQATSMSSDQQGTFYGKIDLGNVGVMGHSMGGAAAYQVCKTDTRCKAAIDLDGTLYGDTKTISRVPFMYLSSDHSKDQGATKQEDDYNDSLLVQQTQDTYHVSIAHTAHFNFSDLALYSVKPAMQLFGVVSSIDGKQGIFLTNTYVNDMFTKYLKHETASHLDSANQLHDATVQRVHQ